MARLESIAKAGRYVTPPEITQLIISNCVPAQTGSILDPCCAQGEALGAMGRALGLETWGNEIQQDIREYGPQNLDHWVLGPTEWLRVEGKASMLLFNPPYDEEDGGRLETRFLNLAAPWLIPGGLIAAIVPRSTLNNYDFRQAFTHFFETPIFRRFPGKHYELFKQVVLFALRRDLSRRGTRPFSWISDEFPIPELRAGEFHYLPRNSHITDMQCALPAVAEALVSLPTEGVRATKGWADFTAVPVSSGEFQPAQRLRPGHVAMLMATGMLNGCEISTSTGQQLVKGYAARFVEETEATETEDGGARVVEQDRIAIRASTLNLTTQEFDEYDSLANPERFEGFLNEHLEALFQWVETHFPPLYKGELVSGEHWKTTRWSETLEQVHAPGVLPGVVENGLFHAQAETAGTILTLWERCGIALLAGRMGVGKTVTAAAVAAARYFTAVKTSPRVIVISPSNVVPKWCREIERSLSEFSPLVVNARTVSDVIKAFAHPGLVFIVMSYEKAKAGSGWAPVLKTDSVTQKVYQGYPHHQYIDMEVISYTCLDCGAEQEEYDPKSKHICEKCKSPMFVCGQADGSFKNVGLGITTTPTKAIELLVGYRRYPLAEFISQHFRNRYILIVDEAHKAKAANTQQAQAVTDLLSSAHRAMLMTGTFYGGKASTIFHLLYRALPKFRQLYRHDEEQRFVNNYGLIETTTFFKRGQSRTTTSHGGYHHTNQSTRYRELPGCNPALIAWLLPYTAFLRLEDLGVVLPKRVEELLPVKMTEEMAAIYSRDLGTLLEDARKEAFKKNLGPFSVWLQAALGWPDLPNAEELFAKVEKRLKKYPVRAAPDNGETPKVRAICDDILDQWGQNRMSMVFFSQVNRRDPMPDYEAALVSRGLRPFILRQSIAPEKREEAYFDALASGHNAFLMNGRLVQEGVDMVMIKNIYRAQIDYSPYSVAQSNARIDRLGQTKTPRIVYAYYEDSIQQIATSLMANKLSAIAMLDGDVAEGLAAMGSSGDSFMRELMKRVMNNEKLVPPPQWKVVERSVPAAPIVFEAQLDKKDRPQPGTYLIVHTGLGNIEVRNGRTVATLSWLGGEELYGEPLWVEIARLANPADQPHRRRWKVEVEYKEG